MTSFAAAENWYVFVWPGVVIESETVWPKGSASCASADETRHATTARVTRSLQARFILRMALPGIQHQMFARQGNSFATNKTALSPSAAWV
jgi:hypothetical protein